MQLTSAIRIGRPAPEVLDALLDPGKVAACLPGSRLIGEVADGTYAGELRLRIGPVHAVYAGTVHLDAADRAAGTATLSASGRERSGRGSAAANVTLRVVPHGATTRVLISADLMIRGTVAQYSAGAIGDVSQRLVEQFAGNVEQLLTHADDLAETPVPDVAAGPSGWLAGPGRKRAAAAVALLTAGTLAGLAAWLMWRRRGAAAGGWRLGRLPRAGRPPATPAQDPAVPRYSSPEGARHD